MTRLAASAVLVAASLHAQAPRVPAADPFLFFAPTVAVSAHERQQLDRGEPVARIVPSSGSEVAVFAAVGVGVDAGRLHRWMHRIAALKQSTFVPEIGRFSDPPRPSDLDALTVDEDDLDAVRRCRPGRCGMKLTAAEMAALQHAGPSGARGVQQAFRGIVLARVQAYLAGGQAALARYADAEEAPALTATSALILQHTPFLPVRAPAVASCLEQAPCAAAAPIETFVYWSKEHFGGRHVVSATHVVIAPAAAAGGPELLVAGKQIFATHYMNGSLGLTALVGDGNRRYLAYLNRSSVDLLDGMFGGLVRLLVQRRLASDAPAILDGLRRRVEGGDPP